MQKGAEKRLRLNNLIRVPEVQVIDETGKQLGVMPVHEALRLANEKGLDLVEVGPQAKPPMTKIMDFGKYLYQKEKRQHSGKQKAPAQEVKTLRIGFKTGIHDLMVRASQIDKFIKKGFRVRLQLVLRGREREMAALGKDKLVKFLDLISEPFAKESEIKRFPGGFELVLKLGKH